MDNSIRENINKIIRNNVRYIRKTHKLSKEKFAEQVELSSQFISDVERGIEGMKHFGGGFEALYSRRLKIQRNF